MKPRPVLAVLAPPVAAGEGAECRRRRGRFRITSPIFCSSRIISSGEVSCAASAKAEIMPVSWIGKKPLGIWIAMTTVSAMVAKNTPSVIALVAQHDVERAPVERRPCASKPRLDEAIDAAVLLGCPVHEARAHHRRERQRNQRRNRDRGRHRQREFAEQAADDAAHQQQRDEHRDQRAGDRQHREADLARALDARPRTAARPPRCGGRCSRPRRWRRRPRSRPRWSAPSATGCRG